jgi:hypothetical protein
VRNKPVNVSDHRKCKQHRASENEKYSASESVESGLASRTGLATDHQSELVSDDFEVCERKKDDLPHNKQSEHDEHHWQEVYVQHNQVESSRLEGKHYRTENKVQAAQRKEY